MQKFIVERPRNEAEEKSVRIAVFRVHVGHGDAVNEVLVKLLPALVGVLLVPGTSVIPECGEGKSQVQQQESEKGDSLFHFHRAENLMGLF